MFGGWAVTEVKTIVADEGLTVHWHNKKFAVIKTYGLLTGNMYQIYENVGSSKWERRPINGIELYKTIKGAVAHIKEISK